MSNARYALEIKDFTSKLLFFLLLVITGFSAYATGPKTSQTTTHTPDCETPVVTREGAVSGFDAEKNGIPVCAYKGIPYAKAPIGDLRWQAPQDSNPRGELLQATSFGPDCMQNRWLSDATIQTAATETSEDCLYLNIWRPKKAGSYPVMVWIHGGGLLLGSAAWPIYEGTSLVANQDVVLVTINYRLGAFGYLAHPALEDKQDGIKGASTGNYGLLDQLKALQWVQANIDNFSGDAANVTIFGESAGGWSIYTLMSSPYSEGLFHKAIAQSGASEATHSTERAFEIGKRFAKNLNCSEVDIATCLRNLPVEAINQQSLKANARCTLTGKIGNNFCFIPREDGTLLPDEPMSVIRTGHYQKVPIMAGYTSKDPWFLKNSTIETIALMQDQPNWLFEFKFKRSAMDVFVSGVHGTELPFVFDTLEDFKVFYNKYPLFKEKHIEKAEHLVASMQSYWGNFAWYGDPNGAEQNTALVEWPQHAGKARLFLGNEIMVVEE